MPHSSIKVRWTLWGAMGLHLCLAWLLNALVPAAGTRASWLLPARQTADIEVELDKRAPPATKAPIRAPMESRDAPDRPPSRPALAARPPRGATASRSDKSRLGVAESPLGGATAAVEEGPGPSPGEGPDAADPYASDPYGAGPGGTGQLPGLGGPPLWTLGGTYPAGPGGPAPTAAPRRRAVHRDIAGQVLRRGIRKKDSGLNLSFPGAAKIASVLAAAVRQHTRASALAAFAVQVDGAGKVRSVRLLHVTAGSAERWRRAARHALAALQSHTFPLRSDYAAGALVTVDLRASLQLPSGSGGLPEKRPIEPPRWPWTPKPPTTGRSFRTPSWGPPPKSAPGVSAQGAGIGVGFDVADIGATPQRVIHTRFQVTPR